MTASKLFAGNRHITGDNNCYYCGTDCDSTYGVKQYVKDTFTNRDIVKYPASQYVCQGCAMSLGDGWADMEMIDGSVKEFTTPRSMAPRMYSWLITEGKRLAFTKAHIPIVRGKLTDAEKLPDPPFSWVLSDSGKKHLIFRAPVALSREAFGVMLEEKEILVVPGLLKDRLGLAARISSKIGKPVLRDPVVMSTYIAAKKAGVVGDLEAWAKVRQEPLSQLAAWLAPCKDK